MYEPTLGSQSIFGRTAKKAGGPHVYGFKEPPIKGALLSPHYLGSFSVSKSLTGYQVMKGA